jgi:hypothetical protein
VLAASQQLNLDVDVPPPPPPPPLMLLLPPLERLCDVTLRRLLVRDFSLSVGA